MSELNELFIRDVNIDWEGVSRWSYLRRIPALESLHRMEFTCPVTFFVGENGSGKSTLLEAIAVAYGFNPEGGTSNYFFSTYDSHSELCEAIRLVKGYRLAKWGYFLRAESFYNVATKEEEYKLGLSAGYHRQSHGESFLSIVQDNFRENSLYILDEPEAALSPQRQLTLLLEIQKWAQRGFQFIIVSHSPILLGIPGADILSFDGDALHKISYEETDSYQITSLFLADRFELLGKLLN